MKNSSANKTNWVNVFLFVVTTQNNFAKTPTSFLLHITLKLLFENSIPSARTKNSLQVAFWWFSKKKKLIASTNQWAVAMMMMVVSEMFRKKLQKDKSLAKKRNSSFIRRLWNHAKLSFSRWLRRWGAARGWAMFFSRLFPCRLFFVLDIRLFYNLILARASLWWSGKKNILIKFSLSISHNRKWSSCINSHFIVLISRAFSILLLLLWTLLRHGRVIIVIVSLSTFAIFSFLILMRASSRRITSVFFAGSWATASRLQVN